MLFANSAYRASPVFREISEFNSAVFRWVVHPAADIAYVFFHFNFPFFLGRHSTIFSQVSAIHFFCEKSRSHPLQYLV